MQITSELETVRGDIPDELHSQNLAERVALNAIKEASKGTSQATVISGVSLPRRIREIIKLAGTVLADETSVNFDLIYRRAEMYKYRFALRWPVDNPRMIARLSLIPLIYGTLFESGVMYKGIKIESYNSKGRFVYGFLDSEEDPFLKEVGERGRLLMALGLEENNNVSSYQLELIKEVSGLFVHP